MTGRRKYEEGSEQLMIQSIQHHLWNMVSSVMAWACMASGSTGLLVFIDDVMEDRSSRITSEVYRDILSAQIQSYGAKLIGRRFIVQVDNDPKHTAKTTQEFFQGNKVEYSALAKSISWFQPDWDCILLSEDKTKGRKTYKQTITEVSCSKGLGKHHKGGNPDSGVHEFHT